MILHAEVMLALVITSGELVVKLDRIAPPLPAHLRYLQAPYSRRRLASLRDFPAAQLADASIKLAYGDKAAGAA